MGVLFASDKNCSEYNEEKTLFKIFFSRENWQKHVCFLHCSWLHGVLGHVISFQWALKQIAYCLNPCVFIYQLGFIF